MGRPCKQYRHTEGAVCRVCGVRLDDSNSVYQRHKCIVCQRLAVKECLRLKRIKDRQHKFYRTKGSRLDNSSDNDLSNEEANSLEGDYIYC